MKECFKCHKTKEMSEFYKHQGTKDKVLGKCKECTKKDVRQYRAENIEKVREYDRKRGGEKHRMEANKTRTKEYRKRFPNKYKAHTMVNNAIRSGKIEKPEKCIVCGGKRQIEAHHDDYKKPLEVQWICSSCHSGLHHSNMLIMRL